METVRNTKYPIDRDFKLRLYFSLLRDMIHRENETVQVHGWIFVLIMMFIFLSKAPPEYKKINDNL